MIWKSSLARKYWMSFTGLFLCLFLVGHLIGNLQLVNPDIEAAKNSFNLYAKFMVTNPAVKVLSILTYISVLLHIIDGLIIWARNRSARPIKYKKVRAGNSSSWASRNMAFLGSVILVFLIIHLKMYWAVMKFGSISTYKINGEEVKDLYSLTVCSFQDAQFGLVTTIFYAVSVIFLGLHLSHGFKSAFQSFGLSNPKYNGIIDMSGKIFSVIITAGYLIIPLVAFFVLERI